MTNTLMNELADAKQIDLVQPASQLLKLHCLKTKLKNCLTTDLAHDIDTYMPTGLSHKDRRLFFIKLVSHTSPDKEAHTRIIYEYILKLEIIESNNMESFTRELRIHIKQYDAMQGREWKKITYHIIRQYQKIDSPLFNTGFNMIIVWRPSTADIKYGWLCILLEWTNSTHNDLITRNLWPKPEITTNQELNTMPLHDKQWGTDLNLWKSHGTAEKSKTWAESSTKLTTPRSISTAETMDPSKISYDPYLSTHVFTKVNINAPKPTYNIWIGVSQVFLPTFWCLKCNSWSGHHDKLNRENKPSKVTTDLLNFRTEHMVEMITTNDLTPHTVVITAKTNVHEMIADDHPREMAPTPTRAVCAAQVITTKMVQHSTTTKINIRSHTKHLVSGSTTEIHQAHSV
jgi:hypothetical protein